MLSLSLTTGYAIRALCCLQHHRGLVLARRIARKTGIPKPYLSKILHALGRYGLITTKRGYRGGFALSRPAGEIRLLDIVQAVEGVRWKPRCLLGLEVCSDERACPTHRFWKRQRAAIEGQLSRLTLHDVAAFEARGARRGARGRRRTARTPAARDRRGRSRAARAARTPLALMWCAACLLTGAARGQATTAAAPLRPTTLAGRCVGSGCHDDIVNRPVMHGPVAQHRCESCHSVLEPREHKFKEAMPRARMCVGCHVMAFRDVVHQPVAVGDCTACHDPHGSALPMLLRADPARTLCLSCHDDMGFSQRKYVHGPVAAGACILCHESHSSWHGGLLKKPVDALCHTCHEPVQQAVRRERHVHAPVAEGRCTDCHDPHASDFVGQLRAGGERLCGECHAPVEHRIATAAVRHGPAVGQDACVECHVGHASALPRLQRHPQPAACLRCHNRVLHDAAGRPIADIQRLLAEHPHHHGPIRDGNCSACHDPHASSHQRLLAATYPPEFYAPFEAGRYLLCFSCHRPEMIGSPGGLGVTNFRDGDRNLHHLHVNREKGRTCRACHEVHASRRPFHIRESIPFGRDNWLLEINFEQTETGGFCAPGCHAPQTYDRNRTTPPVSAPPGGLQP